MYKFVLFVVLLMGSVNTYSGGIDALSTGRLNPLFNSADIDYLSMKGTIKFGVTQHRRLPFWGGTKELPIGMTHDFAELLKAETGVSFDYVVYDDMDSLIKGLVSGEVDASVGFESDSFRNGSFLYSSPIYEIRLTAWIKNDYDESALEQLNWACIEGSPACKVLAELGYKNIEKLVSINNFYSKFEEGKLDALLDNYSALRFFLSENNISFGSLYFNEEFGSYKTSVLISPKEPKLKSIINRIFNTIDFDSNTLKKYSVNSDVYANYLYNDLLFNSSLKKVVKYTMPENSFPMFYYDERFGHYKGFIYDLISRIEARTPLRFEYIPPKGNDIYDMLKSGSVDIIPVANSNLIDRDLFSYTKPYTTMKFGYIESLVIDKKSLSRIESVKGLDEKHIGILDRLNIIDADSLPSNFQLYSNLNSIVGDIDSGRLLSAYINIDLLESLTVSGLGSSFEIVPSPKYNHLGVDISMAFNINDPLMKLMLSDILDSFNEVEIQSLWLPYKRMTYKWGYDKKDVFFYSFIVFLFIILSIYLINNRLKKQITASNEIASEFEVENLWLTQLINAIQSMIVISNSNSEVVLCNDAYKDFIRDSHLDHQKELLSILLSSGSVKLNEEFSVVINFDELTDELTNSHFHVINTLIKHPINKKLYSLTVFNDISELKNNEISLIEYNKQALELVEARDKFLAIVSHELRTPISAISGLMEILKDRITNSQDLEILDNAIHSSDKLKVIVNDILDLSKIEANKLKLDNVECNLANELCPMFRTYEENANAKNIDFIFHWDATPYLDVVIDPVRVTQVISNILSNSLKFTDAGFIKVKVSVTEDLLTISIKDTGIGMTEEQRKHIFEAFTQAEDNISRRFGGTGLGMSIVSNLINLMGGSIKVESILDFGTVVDICIPIEARVYKAIAPELVEVSDERLLQWFDALDLRYSINPKNGGIVENFAKNLYPDLVLQYVHGLNEDLEYDNVSKSISRLEGTVAVVDDDAINRFVIAQQLKDIGLDVDLYEKATHLLASLKIKNAKYNIIITDCHMPEINGFVLATKIRNEIKGGKHLPIIAFTADNSLSIKEKALSVGINDVLYKPYDIDDLHKLIMIYLDQEKDIDSANNWLAQYPEEQRTDMANAVIESFTTVVSELEEGLNIRENSHKVKGASSVLKLEHMVKIATDLELEPKNEENKKKLIENMKSILVDADDYIFTSTK